MDGIGQQRRICLHGQTPVDDGERLRRPSKLRDLVFCPSTNPAERSSDTLHKASELGPGGEDMSHVLELTDEQYKTLTEAARKRGQTAEAVLAQLIAALGEMNRPPQGLETDDWLRHLGVSEDEIEASKRRVRAEAERPYDADA